MRARFRLWRERKLPRASYQLEPVFWTPAGLARASGRDEYERQMFKRAEPQISGLAHTARRLHLVMVAGAGSYDHVAKLMHARALVRDDPDYADHAGKHVSMLLIADQVPASVADFARRHRVRIVTHDSPPAGEPVIEPPPAATSNPQPGDLSDQLCR